MEAEMARKRGKSVAAQFYRLADRNDPAALAVLEVMRARGSMKDAAKSLKIPDGEIVALVIKGLKQVESDFDSENGGERQTPEPVDRHIFAVETARWTLSCAIKARNRARASVYLSEGEVFLRRLARSLGTRFLIWVYARNVFAQAAKIFSRLIGWIGMAR